MKKQGDTTMYLSEWPKSRILTIPNTGEDVEQRELLVGMQRVIATLETVWQFVFNKAKHSLGT